MIVIPKGSSTIDVPGTKNLPAGDMIYLHVDQAKQRINGLTVPVSSLGEQYQQAVSDFEVQTIYVELTDQETYVEQYENNVRVPKIRVGENVYGLAEYMNVRKFRNLEAFNKLDPLLGTIYMKALEDNPELLGINVFVVNDEEVPEMEDSFGFFNGNNNSIYIPSDKSKYLPQNRKDLDPVDLLISVVDFNTFVNIFGDMTNMSSEEVVRNIRRTTLLHELGHAKHLATYIAKYGARGKEIWDQESRIEYGKMKSYVINRSGKVVIFDKFGIRIEKVDWKRWEEEMRRKIAHNVRAYRNIPFEEYADNFMLHYINEFREEVLALPQ